MSSTKLHPDSPRRTSNSDAASRSSKHSSPRVAKGESRRGERPSATYGPGDPARSPRGVRNTEDARTDQASPSITADTEDSISELKAEITRVFAPDGMLAQHLPAYRLRPQQLEMSLAVAQALEDGSTLVVEAGTGTGKTYAYLAPVLLSGGKVLVSTGTKTLQDQLYARDLPQLVAALQLPASTALLKGRSNYLCHWHLQRTQDDARGLASREEVDQLTRIVRFAKRTQTGDRAELGEVPENAPIWDRVTSTRDTCLGSDCEYYRECFVVKARKAAQEAEVVVVNHALFLADVALKDEGITDLLPAVDCVVFDEAHQLPEVATRFLGESVSTYQLLEFARDALARGRVHSRESADWEALTRQLEQSARELRLACASIQQMPGQKSAFDAIPDRASFEEALSSTIDALVRLGQVLHAVRERHPDLELLSRRGPELVARLQRWLPDMPLNKEADEAASTATATPDHLNGLQMQAQVARKGNSDTKKVSSADAAAWVRWVETTTNHIRLHAAPLSVAHAFTRYRPQGQAWIFTSATLAVRRDFTHFTRQLGLGDVITGQWESPFDYESRGRLFVPHGLPEPNHPEFTSDFANTLIPMLEASQGHALILCTTLRAVDHVHAKLSAAFKARGWSWPLLKQGERSRRELLDVLRSQPHAVLVGSASFWEGIDVPGDALTLVAIDKLPFAPPDDPVLEARINACRKRGGNPFFEFQLPQAAIALKQGAGRLIRAEDDWGVLMVGDRRLVEKPYGKLLWRGLPPFTRTRSLQDVIAFLKERTGTSRQVNEH